MTAWIGPGVDRVAYEPTGAWHRSFEEALLEAGVPLYAINPYQVRCFARSLGSRAKTDATDARTLALMAAAINDLRPTPKRSRTQRHLSELQVVRGALVADRTAIGNRGRHLRHPLAKRLNNLRRSTTATMCWSPAQAERQLKLVDAEIRTLVRRDEELRRRAEILTSIPGISDVTAAGLVVHLPELGSMTGPQAASLAGLAPVTRESGAWRGRSFIQGGRPKVRRILCMPALAAVRGNPDLRRRHEALRAAGKPPKVALTAVMRKLVVLANALVQQDRPWAPEPPVAA